MTNPQPDEIERVARAICWAMSEETDDCSSTCMNAKRCMVAEVDDCFKRDATAALAAMSPELTREGFAPCPMCKQYSHSLGEDRIAEAFNHFHTMIAHPVRGHPMGDAFDEKAQDAAQVLTAELTRLREQVAAIEGRARILVWNVEKAKGKSDDDAMRVVNHWIAALTNTTDGGK